MKIIPFYNKEELIKRAQEGDRSAQRIIYEQYSSKMLSVCRMYIKDLQFAEDVMLKGFLKVYMQLERFRFEGSFEGWIRRIMVREAIDFLRVHKQLEFSTDLEETSLLKTVDVQHGNYEVDYIQSLIDELPEGYKVVFVMAAIEGYKHKEIAEELGISMGASKSQLAKARKALQKHFHIKQVKR